MRNLITSNRFKQGTVCLIAAILAGLNLYPFQLSAATPENQQVQEKNLKAQVDQAIRRGAAWLQKKQNPAGHWSSEEYPAITALALVALEGASSAPKSKTKPEWMQKGYDYLLSHAKPDGGIYKTNLQTYNTSICLLALQTSGNPEYKETIINGRNFLTSLQRDFGTKGELDTPFDGGIGYGSKYEHSDMGNTLQALEALYYTKPAVNDTRADSVKELNYAAAIHFLQSCQNLPSHNKEKWASDDAKNKGGFIYYPGHSMAGTETNSATGRIALRSYGSISYGGMLSFIYAGLTPDDARVKAVYEWLRNNYTLDENPGMGKQGLYYYYHTMAKALNLIGVEQIELPDGRKIDWRRDLAARILKLQQDDGYWVNDNARWFEKDDMLVTSYCLMALEIINAKLK